MEPGSCKWASSYKQAKVVGEKRLKLDIHETDNYGPLVRVISDIEQTVGFSERGYRCECIGVSEAQSCRSKWAAASRSSSSELYMNV